MGETNGRKRSREREREREREVGERVECGGIGREGVESGAERFGMRPGREANRSEYA
jgi:hypothetical protein